MAAVLGMRGSGSYTVGGTYAERPESWREGILRLYPNGHAPLTAILSMMDSQQVPDSIFHWFQQELADFRIYVNNGAGYGAGDTTIAVDDSAGNGMARKTVRGSIGINETTREVFHVTQDPATVDSIEISRGMGEVAADVFLDNDVLHIFSNAFEQGSSIPTAMSFDPTHCVNYCQILRESLAQTRTAMRTKLRTGDSYEKAKLEALDNMSQKMEMAFILGQLDSSTLNGQLKLTTRGFYQWMIGDCDCCADGTNVFAEDGTMTKAEFNSHLNAVMAYGSTNKLLLCGATFLNTLNTLFEGAVTQNVVPGDETYGLSIHRWMTAAGEIYVKQHPLMARHPVLTMDAMILDLDNLQYKYVDDLDFVTNRQDPGTDGRMDEFIVECGFEFHQAKTHGLITGVTGPA